MIEFKLYYKFDGSLSLNSRAHWTSKAKHKQQIEKEVYYALREMSSKIKPFSKPVEVIIRYNTMLDIDNHGYITKCIIDGMRYSGLIKDDNKKYVRRVVQELWNGKYTSVTVDRCKD